MKKISLLFACIGILTFTANAQEPVKAKQTKEPVNVTPMERPIKVAPSTAEKAPRANTETTVVAKSTTPATIANKKPKKHIMNPTKAKATATPVVKAGEAK